MTSASMVITALSSVGVRGLMKSVFNSIKYTNKPDSLALHSKVIVDISPQTVFNINDRFEVGVGTRGATHPRISRSKFSTTDGSSVSHTGEHRANIGPGSVVYVEGDFLIGDSYINSHSRIICGERISIGDDVAIAWGFEIIDDNRHQLTVDGDKRPQKSPIEIKDNVWVGHSVSVHKGVTIHEGSVVASDSVVTSDVPPHTLVAGCPAEVVQENVEWTA